jgi:hypothetical protein
MDVDWRPVPSPCLTLVRPLLTLSIQSQTIRCYKTLFPYRTDIILCILTPDTPSADINGSMPSALLWCKWIWSVHVYGTKRMPEMDYQVHTCTKVVGEEYAMCILSSPTSSIINCKTLRIICDSPTYNELPHLTPTQMPQLTSYRKILTPCHRLRLGTSRRAGAEEFNLPHDYVRDQRSKVKQPQVVPSGGRQLAGGGIEAGGHVRLYLAHSTYILVSYYREALFLSHTLKLEVRW